MTALEKLLTDYVAAAIRHREGTQSGDYRKTNRAADTLTRLMVDLEKDGAPGSKAFVALMDHEDVGVRCWAASDCLFIPGQEKKARAVIDEIARGAGMIGVSAAMILDVWNKGELHNSWPSGRANCNCDTCRRARGEAAKEISQ